MTAPQRRPATRRMRHWSIGFVTGLCVGVGVLVAGTLVALLGIIALVLLSIERERQAGVGGLFAGFGLGWLALIGTSPARCGDGCVFPDLTPWIAASIGMLIVGVLLTWRATQRHGEPSTAGRS